MTGDPRKPFGPSTHYVKAACERCHGKGWIEERDPGTGLPTRDCKKCGGTGKVFAKWTDDQN